MNADELLRHYERIADAPEAVARLRRFILDLAVRGKLVPQDSRDEPASELLKKIAAEKARVGLEPGHSRMTPEQAPFSLPSGWCWSSVGEICSKTGSGSTPRGGQATYATTGVPFLRSQNICNVGLRLDDVAYIDAATHARMAGTSVRAKDLLLNITGGSIGRCCRVPDTFSEANISQHVAIIRPAISAMSDFLHGLVLSPYFQSFVVDEQTGAGRGGLPKNRMDRIAVAMPPLAEQHRIVAKVDEMMALCDRLDAARSQREAARDRLARSCLVRLDTPDPETFREDARFALDALPALTARTDQIKQLRQTILNLAVRGKLAPQDSMDEPASVQLIRIAAERKILGLAPSQRPAGIDGTPFPLPAGWSWSRIGEVCSKTGSGSTPRGGQAAYVGSGIPFLRSQNVHDDGLRLEEVAYIDAETHARMAGTAVRPHDLLLNITGGSIGRCCRVEDTLGQANISQHVAILRPVVSAMADFLHCLVLSPYFQRFVVHEQTGAGRGGLPKSRMDQIAVAVPPLAEQHRIVARVAELMALSDRLEASLAQADAHRRHLLEALLHQALSPAVAREEQAA